MSKNCTLCDNPIVTSRGYTSRTCPECTTTMVESWINRILAILDVLSPKQLNRLTRAAFLLRLNAMNTLKSNDWNVDKPPFNKER